MQIRFSPSTIAVALAVFAAQSPSIAQAQTAGGWYAGTSLGQSGQNLRTENVAAPVSGNQKTTDTGYKVFGGYQFTPNWAAEIQYFNLGKYQYSDAAKNSAVIKTSGFSFAGVGTLPVSQNFSVLGKIGLSQQSFAANLLSGTSQQSRNASGTSLLMGLGGEYEISKNVLIRAEYEYLGVPTLLSAGSQKVKLSNNLVSVGLRYRF